MTELLFQKDSYLKEFDAEILEIVDGKIVLNRTAFSPRGGGLASDIGIIKTEDGLEFNVLESTSKSGKVFHHVEPIATENLEGKRILGFIDWERRYKQMRLHTVLHSISGILFKQYGSTVTGGNITPEKSRVDFEIDHMRQERVQEIEDAIIKVIEGKHPVTISFLERDEALKDQELIRTKVNLIPESVKIIRIIDIQDVDKQADGGVHVANTSEIGRFIPIKSENRGKNNKRLYFTVSP